MVGLEEWMLDACSVGSSWAQHRKEEVRYLPKNIDPHLCTHAYFAFANIDLDKMALSTFEKNDISDNPEIPVSTPHTYSWPSGVTKVFESYFWLTTTHQSLYGEFNKLKRKNPQMKTLLSLGGASAGIEKFRKLISSDDDRKKFIKNTIRTLREHNFDGLDLGKKAVCWSQWLVSSGSPKLNGGCPLCGKIGSSRKQLTRLDSPNLSKWVQVIRVDLAWYSLT